jgi:hypothetical protein
MIARSGIGYDSIDVDAGTARGIAVGNTPGVNHSAIAEMATAASAARLRIWTVSRPSVADPTPQLPSVGNFPKGDNSLMPWAFETAPIDLRSGAGALSA